MYLLFKYQDFVLQFAKDDKQLLIYIFLFSVIGRLKLTGYTNVTVWRSG